MCSGPSVGHTAFVLSPEKEKDNTDATINNPAKLTGAREKRS